MGANRKRVLSIAAGLLTATQITIGMIGATRAHAAVTAPQPRIVLTAYSDGGKPPGTAGAVQWPAQRAMDWAITQAGCWYSWGGTNCSPGFDCSGLVMTAYAHVGIHLPRTTYDMLNDVGRIHRERHFWWVLVKVAHPGRGDLAFYGSGHVELKTIFRHGTFGAPEPGKKVGWHKWGFGWVPTGFYRVEVHRR